MARGWSQAYRDEDEGGDGGGEGQSVLGWVRGKGAEVIQSRRTGDRGQRTVRSEQQRSAGPGRPCLRASGSLLALHRSILLRYQGTNLALKPEGHAEEQCMCGRNKISLDSAEITCDLCGTCPRERH